jgi:mono/diheme cytochrome c family protein
MRPCWIATLALLLASFPQASAQSSPAWHENRQFASDLEVKGALVGLPPGSTRYVTRSELLAMPQVSFTVTDDTNFNGPANIRGVKLEELARRLAASPASAMVVAICDDSYLSAYPRDYLAGHHPVLVLEVNNKPPSGWPKAAEDHASDMGPYMISNPKFTPSFKVLSHSDEAQIPWGVVRLEFRDEKAVLGAIAPRGPHAEDADVQAGYRIASQNCLRCHNAGSEGGQKSGRPWDLLGGRAAGSPKEFAAYIRAPQTKNPRAQMPANPTYDDATLAALTAYFRTFSPSSKP